MGSERTVWLLGGKTSNVHKSILWDEPFPNFSEPDIIIIDLSSLSQRIVEKFDEEKYSNAQQEIFEKFLSGGTLIFITSRKLSRTAIPHLDSYKLSPFKFGVREVNMAKKIKASKTNLFSSYISKLDNFYFYLYEIELKHGEIIRTCNSEYLDVIRHPSGRSELSVQINEVRQNRVTDNSNHILSCTYFLTKDVDYRSGEITFLPPLDEQPVEEAVDAILEGLKLKTREEAPPRWISSIPFPGISNLEAKLARFQQSKKNIQAKIEKTNAEIQDLTKYYKLLYSTGTHLENIVRDSFAYLGFNEIKRPIEANREDWVIEFHQTDSTYKFGIIEVHGTENRTTEKKLTQCNKYVDEYFEKDRTLVKGIFVPNQHRLANYPNSKVKRMHFEPLELKYAKNKSVCVIPSCVLFELMRNQFNGPKNSRIELEKIIAETNGILSSF